MVKIITSLLYSVLLSILVVSVNAEPNWSSGRVCVNLNLELNFVIGANAKNLDGDLMKSLKRDTDYRIKTKSLKPYKEGVRWVEVTVLQESGEALSLGKQKELLNVWFKDANWIDEVAPITFMGPTMIAVFKDAVNRNVYWVLEVGDHILLYLATKCGDGYYQSWPGLKVGVIPEGDLAKEIYMVADAYNKRLLKGLGKGADK